MAVMNPLTENPTAGADDESLALAREIQKRALQDTLALLNAPPREEKPSPFEALPFILAPIAEAFRPGFGASTLQAGMESQARGREERTRRKERDETRREAALQRAAGLSTGILERHEGRKFQAEQRAEAARIRGEDREDRQAESRSNRAFQAIQVAMGSRNPALTLKVLQGVNPDIAGMLANVQLPELPGEKTFRVKTADGQEVSMTLEQLQHFPEAREKVFGPSGEKQALVDERNRRMISEKMKDAIEANDIARIKRIAEQGGFDPKPYIEQAALLRRERQAEIGRKERPVRDPSETLNRVALANEAQEYIQSRIDEGVPRQQAIDEAVQRYGKGVVFAKPTPRAKPGAVSEEDRALLNEAQRLEGIIARSYGPQKKQAEADLAAIKPRVQAIRQRMAGQGGATPTATTKTVDALPPASSVQEGTVATDTATGKKYVARGGKWVPQ